MSNIVQIKRGRTVPNQGGLMPYELGYIVTKYENEEEVIPNNSEGGYLYIGDLEKIVASQTEGEKPVLVYKPVKIKAGYADIAGMTSGLDNQGIEQVKNIKVDSAASADSATNAKNAENAKKAEEADFATNATNATNATDSLKLENHTYVQILQAIYPVGAIYISTVSTSPAELFDFGTWERIQDTFLLAAGDTYLAGSTGGEAEHILTEEEMPVHSHEFTAIQRDSSKSTLATGSYGYESTEGPTKTAGGGQAHNNMPPYLVVYMWKRTA